MNGKKRKRFKKSDREAVAEKWTKAYEDGWSIRQIAAVEDRPYSTVHDVLMFAGVTFRPRGGQWRKKQES